MELLSHPPGFLKIYFELGTLLCRIVSRILIDYFIETLRLQWLPLDWLNRGIPVNTRLLHKVYLLREMNVARSNLIVSKQDFERFISTGYFEGKLNILSINGNLNIRGNVNMSSGGDCNMRERLETHSSNFLSIQQGFI